MIQSNILTLECTPAATDSPDLAHWTLQFNQRTASGMLPDVPNKQQRVDFRWYFDDYLKWPFLEFRTRAARVEADLVAVGKALFLAIFASSSAATKIYDEWISVDHGVPTLQILSLIPAVLSIPWELLHDDYGFLNQRRLNPVAIYRIAKTIPSTILKHQFAMPLRVLVVIARPDDVGFLDPRTSAQTILAQLQHLERDNKIKPGMIEFEFLRPPTYEQLAYRLQDAKKPIHILHFDGHGGFSKLYHESPYETTTFKAAHTNQGILAFETAHHRLNAVYASDLAKLLNGADIRLVLLDACRTSVMDTSDSNDTDHQRQQALSSVATQLLTAGVPAVVAMSASVLPKTTAIFFGEFYGAIADGKPVPLALERARQALQSQPMRLYLARNPDKEAESITLEDWWLPHFYQQREINLIPIGKRSRPKSAKLSGFGENPHQRPFIGRAKELLQIERALLKSKIVLLYGFGGVGKTRLASEAAAWLTQTKLYHGALFLSFEHGGNQIVLLSAIARHYELPETDSHDLSAAVKRLKPYLRKKPLLIIIDNLESILPYEGNAEINVLDARERQVLWDCILDLHAAGVGMILTSRDHDLRDSRLQQGLFASVIAISGLDAHSAYAFASVLLDDLAIDRRRAPKLQLSNLLERLDYHPLAINLTLRALHDPSLSIEQLLDDYGSILTQCIDETSPIQRHRSLEASLTYSLQRISPIYRDYLIRLAPFEGGALETTLLTITNIPAQHWSQLRSILEHTGLISTILLEDVLVPFLRFHPTLIPYLRYYYPGYREIEEQYVMVYFKLCSDYYDLSMLYNKSILRIVRSELPNLQKTLEILIKNNKIDEIILIIEFINKFYQYFGMYREMEVINRLISGNHHNIQSVFIEYIKESNIGEMEIGNGEYSMAYERFQRLIDYVSKDDNDKNISIGLYEQSKIIGRMGFCLYKMKKFPLAKKIIKQSLDMLREVIQEDPDNINYTQQETHLYGLIATIDMESGDFVESEVNYINALNNSNNIKNDHDLVISIVDMGNLSLYKRKYDESIKYYTEALKKSSEFDSPTITARIYHQIGRSFEEMKDWVNAEINYRQSLMIKENIRDYLGIFTTCNQLANITQLSGKSIESERWYQRALQTPCISSFDRGLVFHNLAVLLTTQVQIGSWPQDKLIEAQFYAEQALDISRTSDPAVAEIWKDFDNLARIANLKGESEQAEIYKQQGFVAYAEHPSNRWLIDQESRMLIMLLVSAQNDLLLRDLVSLLPIANIVQRIWAGERDWLLLCNDIENRKIALLILRVLEELEGLELEDKKQKTITPLTTPDPIPSIELVIANWLVGERDVQSFSGLIESICKVVVATMKEEVTVRHSVATHLDVLTNIHDMPMQDTPIFIRTLQEWLRGDTTYVQTLMLQLSEPFQEIISVMKLYIHPVYSQVMPFFVSTATAIQLNDLANTNRLIARLTTAIKQAAEGEADDSPWMDAARGLWAARAILQGESVDLTGLPEVYQDLLLSIHPTPSIDMRITEWLAGKRDEAAFAALLEAIRQAVVSELQGDDVSARQALATQLDALGQHDDLPVDDVRIFVQTLQAWLRDDEAQWQTLLPQLSERFQAVIHQMQIAVHPIYRQVMPLLQAAADALHRNDPAVTDQLVAHLSTMSDQAAAGESEDSPWMDAARALRAARAILQGEVVDPTGLGEIYQAMLGQLQAIAANRAE